MAIADDIASKLGGPEQEHRDIALAFRLDLLLVSNQLFAPNMPAYKIDA